MQSGEDFSFDRAMPPSFSAPSIPIHFKSCFGLLHKNRIQKKRSPPRNAPPMLPQKENALDPNPTYFQAFLKRTRKKLNDMYIYVVRVVPHG